MALPFHPPTSPPGSRPTRFSRQFNTSTPPHISPRQAETPFSRSVPQADLSVVPVNEAQDASNQVDLLVEQSVKLQKDLEKIGFKIKHHEDNLKILQKQINNIDVSILDMQVGTYATVSLGKYHASNGKDHANNNSSNKLSEHEITNQILLQEKTAAGLFCKLKTHHASQASQMPLTKDVLGIVALLGKVPDVNLSRLLSEYLGLDKMMAIVCRTYEGVKTLEWYDKEGQVDDSVGVHGLGSSIGRPIEGRFLVICLEDLGVFAGELEKDPQRKLALLKPRLPNGECPPGFLGFAVNMILLDNQHKFCVTASGHGLRETLFYSLFSQLQVYKTRADMQLARPFITDGAISLDGAIIKSQGMLALGYRKNVEVTFAVSSEYNIPAEISETEEKIKLLVWEKDRINEDMQREHALLQQAKTKFDLKKDEFTRLLQQATTLSPVNQDQSQARRAG